MAAPKTGGMLFRGGPLGGAETRLPDHGIFQVEIDRTADEAESGLSPGAACTSLAVPERTRRTEAIMTKRA